MNQQGKEERRRLVAEAARKQLADGTWPQVMAVFGYPNPKAPRTSDEEFARLKMFYEEVACPNIAAFVELVCFAEKENGMTMSFNFSMRRRLVSGDAPEPTAESAMRLLTSPDLLVGTRRRVEGAAIWLKSFSEVMSTFATESIQVMDKIFGEAVELFKEPSHRMTAQEMFESVVFGKDES